MIESFSVGSGAVLSTMGKVLAAAGSKSFVPPVSRVTKETTCVEESIAGSGTRAEPLQAAAQTALRQASTVLLSLADAICHCFLMLALLRPSRRTRKNRISKALLMFDLNSNSLFKFPPCLPPCHGLKSNLNFPPACLPQCHDLNSNSLFKFHPPALNNGHDLKSNSLFELFFPRVWPMSH